jgi:hypothetical protein
VAQPGREHLFQLAKVAVSGSYHGAIARTDTASRVIAARWTVSSRPSSIPRRLRPGYHPLG